MADGLTEDVIKVGAAAASAGGGLYMVRWFVMWVTGLHRHRQALLDAQDARLDKEWKEIRIAMQERLDRLESQNRALLYGFQHVSGALTKIDPDNPALEAAHRFVESTFPLDMRELVGRAAHALDEAEARRNTAHY